MACMFLLFAALIFICIAAFGANRRFIRDIWIIAKGNRYEGVCIGKFGFKDCEHIVMWTDSDDLERCAHFSVTTFRKPPFPVVVYTLDNSPQKANLGIVSIVCYLPVLILTDLTLFALIFGAIPEWAKIML